jgi:protein-L-isoaspartate(D-aspartate) O-methyltransferase
MVVAAAADSVPEALIDQLAEGGRLAIPLGAEGTTQLLTVFGRHGRELTSQAVCPCRFVPLVAGDISAGDRIASGPENEATGEDAPEDPRED